MRIGLDSTDSREGGCTTHVAIQAWSRIPEFAVRDAPRLVRLNPNVPYKTRGNGALALELGHPVGPPRQVADFEGIPLYAADEVREPNAEERRRIFESFRDAVDELREEGPHSNTGLVAFRAPPPADFYEEAVSRHVEAPDASGAEFSARWGDGRGLIGAVAACAWPMARSTYELIQYRDPSLVGSPRSLDPGLGARLDLVPGTFDNWDPRHGHLRIAPGSPCPVLAGVRGTDPQALLGARTLIGPEAGVSWALFLTNQATGDHLRDRRVSEVRAFDAVRLTLRVHSPPETRRGGHVFLVAEDGTGRVTLAAFEPTKEFRREIERLLPGDEVIVEAAAHEDPGTLSLEAFTLAAPAVDASTHAPACPACGGAMRSNGRRAPYRCPRDGSTASPRSVLSAEAREVGRRVTVPPLIRRHLQRPEALPISALARLRLEAPPA